MKPEMRSSVELIIYLRNRELETPVYRRKSPQIERRRYLVDWISLISNRLALSSQTIHLSVKLLDFFMDSHDIQVSQLEFVAVSCILLAAKLEETDEKVPRLAKVRPLLTGSFDRMSFISLELMILRHFNCNLCLPTAYLFCDAFLPFSLNPSDSFCGAAITDFTAVQKRFQEFVKYFLDISLQNPELVEEASSAVAASVIYCARQVLRLSPSWPPALQILSGYRRSDSFLCISRQLLDVYNQLNNFVPNRRVAPIMMSSQQGEAACRSQDLPPKKKFKTILASVDEGYVSGFNVSPVENDAKEVRIVHKVFETRTNREI